MNLEFYFFAALTGFGICFAVNWFTLGFWRRRRLSPARAEFHHALKPDQAPIPRFGGLGLAVAFAVLLCLPYDDLFGFRLDATRWVIAGTSLAMFGLGFWDDIRAIGAKRKLAGQLVLASATYFLGLGIHHFKIPLGDRIVDLGFYSWPITVLWLVAMTNLINLIDGADGVAGGIALMLMVLLLAVGGSEAMVPLIAAGMTGALLAFLDFNFPPAKIYLGDGGAYFLGFLLGCLTIYNSHKGTVVAALIAPLFVLALPILDTALALARRAVNGLPLFRPDRRHLHHRLLQSGMSRQNLAWGTYIFTAYFLVLGFLAFLWRGQYLALVLGVAALSLLLVASRFSFSREWFNVAGILGKSLASRAEVHYALAQSSWLGMEGARGQNVQSICKDTAFVAQKLGFTNLRIRLEDGERVWKMGNCEPGEYCSKLDTAEDAGRSGFGVPGVCQCYVFKHPLPGAPACFLEVRTPDLGDPGGNDSGSRPSDKLRLNCPSKFELVSEVLAEGWAKSMADWHRQNRLPIRFNQPPVPSTTVQPGLVPALPMSNARVS